MSRVDSALADFQRYLQNEIPPDGGADALAILMAQPPETLMQRVAAWTAEQHRAKGVPVRELLLFAMRKIYITGELQLLDQEAIANYLDRVTGVVIRLCPDHERDVLRNEITQMRRSRLSTMERPRPAVPAVALPEDVVSSEEAAAAKRYSLIFDRLSKEIQSRGGAGTADPQAMAQLLTMAAIRSQTGQQLNQYLEQLKPLAGGKEGNVFVILGGAMPSWDMANLAPGSGAPPSQVNAMEKIIDLAENPAVVMQRFRELVTAAVDKFNEGALAAALWMFDVAEDTITEKKLDLDVVNQIRAAAVEAIDSVQLRKYAENKSKHGAVKFALEFFPSLHLDVLFNQLRGEKSAEYRRKLLGFIEAHGVRGRETALTNLEHELARPDVDTYYLRNLIYILHRTTRDINESVDREFEALSKASDKSQNIYVIKEAATALGQIKTDASVKCLIARLADFEALLLHNDTSTHPVGEMQKLLDRITGALARIGTTAGLLAVARHGMKANPPLGDTRARLAALSQHDLSFDEATVDMLLKTLREEIPGKLLGKLLPKKQDATVKLIEALSGTISDEADDVFRDIASRFPDQDVGKAAAQVLAKRNPPEAQVKSNEPVATLTGELEFFGLPAVMQSLADMRATGVLTVTSKLKQPVSKLVFVDGKYINGQTKHIRGVDALYEALERPSAGSFAFVPYPPERLKTDIQPLDVIGLLLEGVRRHDELQRMLVIVPDATSYVKGTVRPVPHEEEQDAGLVREVWLKASSGNAVGEFERQLPIDGFRVRRLVAHWVEQGSLVAKS